MPPPALVGTGQGWVGACHHDMRRLLRRAALPDQSRSRLAQFTVGGIPRCQA